MEVARAVTAIQAKNDDHYVWISKQGVLFFEIYMSVKSYILSNVMDTVSQVKDKGIPITVPFYMIKIVLYIYIIIKYVLIYSIAFSIVTIAFSIVVFKCTNKNLIHMNIVIIYIYVCVSNFDE